jgi:hypothetical protein
VNRTSVRNLLSFVSVLLAVSAVRKETTISAQGARKDQGQDRSMRSGYAGDAACASCHAEQAISYMHTAHHLTSQLPIDGAPQGSFKENSNLLKILDPAPAIGDPGVSYEMEQRDSGYYVTALTGFPPNLERRSERIDLVIGSGVRGQSFLYWRGDALHELPISYWTEGRQWINSPGYRNGPPNFDRPASPRCLECHVGYIKALSADPASNRYDRASLSPGISCEVCHGPGAQHAALFAKKGAKPKGLDPLILDPKRFSRDRQVELCALCHNGAAQRQIAAAFSYRPGEPLNEYLSEEGTDDALHPDVHANQVGLLKRSRCYLSSAAMSCSTCHDVHSPERAAASYSQRCLSCHRVESCGIEKQRGPSIANNCIDCHMPVEQTNAIVSQTGDKLIRTTMRTHWIKVYPLEE